MKVKFAILLLVAFLTITLISCRQSDIGVGFEDLSERFYSLEEFEFIIEGTIHIEATFLEEFLGSRFNPAEIDEGEAMMMLEMQAMFQTIFPMQILMEGTVSMEHQEMLSTLIQYSNMTNEPIITVDSLLTEEAVYTDLEDTLRRMSLMMEGMVHDMVSAFDEDIPEEDIQMMLLRVSTTFDDTFGTYTHLRTPLAETGIEDFSEAVFSPTVITGGIDAASLLEQEDDIFTHVVQGVEILSLIEEIENVLIRLLTGGIGFSDEGETVDEIMNYMVNSLMAQIKESGETALGDAIILHSLTHENDEFRQLVSISIPGLITMTQSTLYTPQDILPIGVPPQSLTEEELEELLMQVIMDVDIISMFD
jgi:hypothetical protein